MILQTFQVGMKALIRNEKGQILMVHIPKSNGKPAYWDLPGGRMDTGETFLETIKRELIEEIGVEYVGAPKQLLTVQAKITIPVGDTRLPLIIILYEVKLPKEAVIKLDTTSAELDEYQWFSPAQAAENLTTKFPSEFCAVVAG